MAEHVRVDMHCSVRPSNLDIAPTLPALKLWLYMSSVMNKEPLRPQSSGSFMVVQPLDANNPSQETRNVYIYIYRYIYIYIIIHNIYIGKVPILYRKDVCLGGVIPANQEPT